MFTKTLWFMWHMQSFGFSWTTLQTMEEKLRCRRTDTTHRPTYSMARVIRATAWQRFICRCHGVYICIPESQLWPVCVDVTGHVDLTVVTYSGQGQRMSKVAARVLHDHQSTPIQCYSTCPAEHMVCYTSVQQCMGHLWHTCWTASASQTHSPCAVHLNVHFVNLCNNLWPEFMLQSVTFW